MRKHDSERYSYEIRFLVEQLKIVITHCNETDFKAGGRAVEEAIKIIQKEPL